MGAFWFSLLAVILGCAPAYDIRIILHNGTSVDLDVYLEADPLGRRLEILPGETGELELRSPLWINFGIVAHEYELAPVLELGQDRVRLRAGSDGRLHWVEPDASAASEVSTVQPPGFPLSPVSIVDLT